MILILVHSLHSCLLSITDMSLPITIMSYYYDQWCNGATFIFDSQMHHAYKTKIWCSCESTSKQLPKYCIDSTSYVSGPNHHENNRKTLTIFRCSSESVWKVSGRISTLIAHSSLVKLLVEMLNWTLSPIIMVAFVITSPDLKDNRFSVPSTVETRRPKVGSCLSIC